MSEISHAQYKRLTLQTKPIFRCFREWSIVMFDDQQSRTLSRWVFGFCIFIAVLHLSPWWSPSEDSCSYLSIARSLAQNGEPQKYASSQLHFGPLYPFVISPAFIISSRPFLLLSFFHAGLSVLLGISIWYWAKSLIPESAPWLVVMVSANCSLWLYFQRTLSESLFITVLMWTAVSLNVWLRTVSLPQISIGKTAAASLSILCLAMIRRCGVLVAVGYGIVLLSRAYRGQISWLRACFLTLVLGVPASIGVVTYEATMTQERGIIDTASQATWAQMAMEGLQLRVAETGRLLLPGMAKAYGKQGNWLNINMVIYLCFFIGIVWGWLRLVRHYEDGLILTVPFYYLLHILWPFDQGTRYLLPLLPVLLLCLWMASECLGGRRKQVLVFFLMAHILVTVGFRIRDGKRLAEFHRAWPSVDSLAEEIDRSQPLAANTKVPLPIRLMMTYTIDQTVISVSPDEDCPQEVNQFLTTKDQPIPADFDVRRIASNWVLLIRKQIAIPRP